jgi:hypothetical protein
MKLKFFSLLAVFALAFFVTSCCKAPEPDFDFSPNSVANNSAIDPTKVINFSTTQKATWTVVGGGTINANGVYTPPADKGAVVTITATAASGLKVTRTLYVTRSFKLINEIIKGGHVLSFHHGISAGTDFTNLPKSTNWWSDGGNLTKQLTDAGKEQMRATGKALKNMKIGIEEIYISQFTRCEISASLMALDNVFPETKPVPVIKSEALTYFVYDEPNRYAKTMDLMKSLPIIEKYNFLFITHTNFSGNVPTPAPLADLNEGDAAVFKLQPNKGTPVFVGKLTSQELVALQ